jgi:rRNA-processing protein FCF1
MRTLEVNYGQNKGFTFDTCFVIEILKNPTLTKSFTCIKDHKKKFFITDVTLNELEHLGFDKTVVLIKMTKIFHKIIVRGITTEERFFGQKLERICSSLHPGDSAIMAFAKRTHTQLITLDKQLVQSCRFFKVNHNLVTIISSWRVMV